MQPVRTCKQNVYARSDQSGDSYEKSDDPPRTHCSISLHTARDGSPVPRLVTEGGRSFTLHSLIDPRREADRFCRTVKCSESSLIVILGGGFGYHAEVLTDKSKHRVAVVEYAAAVYEEMKKLPERRAVLERDSLHWIAGLGAEDAVDAVLNIRDRYNMHDIRVFVHEPSLRIFPEYYGKLRSRLDAASQVTIKDKFKYAKFRRHRMRILVLNSKYYLLAEIINALRQLGHEVKTLLMPGTVHEGGNQEMLESLLMEIVTFQPDFVLTVNHLGFDRDGILTGLFTDIELPYASWFIDSPVFILEDFRKQLSDYLALFLWDTDYCDDVRESGFKNVYSLPLATDPGIFKPCNISINPLKKYACAVGFVGSSWTASLQECLREMADPEKTVKLIKKIAGRFMASQEKKLENIALALTDDERSLYEYSMAHYRKYFEPAVTWAATQMYRVACVQRLYEFKPLIFGDPGWKDIVNGSTALFSDLNYYDELPYFYNVCTVNFNTTSMQMKTGFNQRVFDVPACASFLITDYREQLEGAFEIGSEIICYHHPDEIPDLVSYYLRHESERQAVTARARTRVLRDHTYRNRLKFLTETMQSVYG